MDRIIADRFHKNVKIIKRNKDENGIAINKEITEIEVNIDWNKTDDDIVSMIVDHVVFNNLKGLDYRINVWPEKVELELISEQPGLFKKIYRRVDSKFKIYCESLNAWYICGSFPHYEADSELAENYEDRFVFVESGVK